MHVKKLQNQREEQIAHSNIGGGFQKLIDKIEYFLTTQLTFETITLNFFRSGFSVSPSLADSTDLQVLIDAFWPDVIVVSWRGFRRHEYRMIPLLEWAVRECFALVNS